MSTPQRGGGSRRPGTGSGNTGENAYTKDMRDREGSYFTPGMRDRQARGKNPYSSGGDDGSEEESSEEEGRKMRLGQGFSSDSFEDREKRAFALSVLDDREQLMMYAQSANDSIPGQRHRFTAMLCGFEPHYQQTAQHQHKQAHDSGSKAGGPSSRREGDLSAAHKGVRG